MKKPLLVSLLVMAVAASGTGWWFTQRGATAASASAPASAASGANATSGRAGPQTVSVVPAQQRDVPVTVEAAGTVVALNSVELRPQVSSTVQKIAVREGQQVRKGDLLFTFDDRADRANLDKARAQLLRDRATLADLERQLARSKELLAQNFIAPSNTDSLRAQVEAQQAAIRADEAAVQAGEVTLGYSTLRAPLGGRLGAIAVNPGSLVQPSGAALATINQIDPIGVSFTLPEGQLGAVLRSAGIQPAESAASAGGQAGAKRPGGNAGKTPAATELSVLLPAERGRAQAGEALGGHLTFVDNAVDTSSGTIRVKGSVANPKQQLWPGQYVTVRLALRTIKDAVVIPQAALIQRGNERSVYVVGADAKAELRPVQTRYPFGELIVVEGVRAGEQIVVDGKQNLRPGGEVRVAAPPGARTASGAASAAGLAASAAASDAAAGAAR